MHSTAFQMNLLGRTKGPSGNCIIPKQAKHVIAMHTASLTFSNSSYLYIDLVTAIYRLETNTLANPIEICACTVAYFVNLTALVCKFDDENTCCCFVAGQQWDHPTLYAHLICQAYFSFVSCIHTILLQRKDKR